MGRHIGRGERMHRYFLLAACECRRSMLKGALHRQVYCVDLSLDSELVLSCCESGEAKLWTVSTGDAMG